jgi:hypothetical protein
MAKSQPLLPLSWNSWFLCRESPVETCNAHLQVDRFTSAR